MTSSFSYDLSLTEAPADAQARVRDVVTEQMRSSADMSPGRGKSGAMVFRPNWGWPLLVAATRRIRGESIHLTFSATDLGTSVAVSGKVAGRGQSVANREFWMRTLVPA